MQIVSTHNLDIDRHLSTVAQRLEPSILSLLSILVYVGVLIDSYLPGNPTDMMSKPNANPPVALAAETCTQLAYNNTVECPLSIHR